jgi:hypothetical protein
VAQWHLQALLRNTVLSACEKEKKNHLVNDGCVTVARDETSANALDLVWPRLVAAEYC